MNIKIIKCACISAYQDKKYGKGKRVANKSGTNSEISSSKWRCTVCGKGQ